MVIIHKMSELCCGFTINFLCSPLKLFMSVPVGVGQVYGCDNPWTGGIFIISLFISSPITCAHAVLGSAVGMVSGERATPQQANENVFLSLSLESLHLQDNLFCFLAYFQNKFKPQSICSNHKMKSLQIPCKMTRRVIIS